MINLLSWEALAALVLGSLFGALFGMIPGLTATLALSLFVPLALFLDPGLVLPAVIGISVAAIFAGDIGSVTVRIPGTAASAAYSNELHGIGRKRSTAYALGLATLPSAVGSLIGTVLLIIGATTLASFAKQFSSFEYFWLALLGLIAGLFASQGSLIKGALSLGAGMLIATIGLDPTLGFSRFSFGEPNLLSGVSYIVALVGLFGLAELFEQAYKGMRKAEPKVGTHALSATNSSLERDYWIAPAQLMLRRKGVFVRASVVGTFVGFLPGAGSDLAAWLSSSFEKMQGRRRSAVKRQEGNDEQSNDSNDETVVLAGTSANNAAVAGAWVPALALGIPGDTLTAIVLGVFLIAGVTPGPRLFTENAGLVTQIYVAFAVASVVIMPLMGYLVARGVTVITRIPYHLLLGFILGLSVVGAYAINNNPFDLFVLVALGLFGFALRRGGFPLAQVVLGMVLGPVLEQNFMTSVIKSSYNLMSFFERPTAIILMLATLAVIFFGIRLNRSFVSGPIPTDERARRGPAGTSDARRDH